MDTSLYFSFLTPSPFLPQTFAKLQYVHTLSLPGEG